MNDNTRDPIEEALAVIEECLREEPVHVRPVYEPIFSERLYLEDDNFGTETFVITVFSESYLVVRNAIRDLNPGHVPIYSDYDCTGKICHQTAKILDIMRTRSGVIATLKMQVARDV